MPKSQISSPLRRLLDDQTGQDIFVDEVSNSAHSSSVSDLSDESLVDFNYSDDEGSTFNIPTTNNRDGLNICMVCDFFWPNIGGVEAHIYHLSQRLVTLGHKVIIITHDYGSNQHRKGTRIGCRYLTSGVKVYYIPTWRVTDQVSLPALYGNAPLSRYIFIRERIDVVHGHAAFSSMSHEAILLAGAMKIPTIFTDHSLFGFESTGSILMNKLLKFTLTDVDHIICVSHTSKENTVLRASIDPARVSVIPNAVISRDFRPDVSLRNPDPERITVVIASRLVYRKGVDLMLNIIPRVCENLNFVDFVIAGDGNRKNEILQMIDAFDLNDRVKLLGAVKHSEIRNVLCLGHIFLNTSLTEAFCIAIVEAASCGLVVVSTKVGGIPEVLPEDMIHYSSTDALSLYDALLKAIKRIRKTPPDVNEFHNRVSAMYNWTDVAERTNTCYRLAINARRKELLSPTYKADKYLKFLGNGILAGPLSCVIICLYSWLIFFLDIFVPRNMVERAVTFDIGKFQRIVQKRKEC